MSTLADVTDPRFTADQLVTLAAFESTPTPPEVREAAVLEEVARRVEAVAEQQYREAWAAWEATLPIVAGAPASTESRIAWARVNQALSDQEALAAALAEVTTTPQAGKNRR